MPKVSGVSRRILPAAGLVVALLVAGVVGYRAIEGWSWFDAFFVTVMALTTVGGGEPGPLSLAGRVFTLALVVVGVGVMMYTVLLLVGFVLEGQLNEAFGWRRARRRVERLKNHFVLCGYGRVGREIAREFAAEKVPFVIVDVNEESLRQAAAHGFLAVTGNAADVEVLKGAGLDRARGLVTAVDSDADNIYVTLSARVLRPDLFIVARANDLEAEPKLRLAGANRIISPYTIGGRRMANLAMRPTAVDFIDNILSVGNADLLLEAIAVPLGSEWSGKLLSQLCHELTDTTILAIKREEEMLYRPAPEIPLAECDELVVAGPPSSIRRIEGLLQGKG
ncbi:MAG: potassium channel protein [Chloroflexota bacterium]|nr:potassium channel protein [Chloroflexota bacterium]